MPWSLARIGRPLSRSVGLSAMHFCWSIRACNLTFSIAPIDPRQKNVLPNDQLRTSLDLDREWFLRVVDHFDGNESSTWAALTLGWTAPWNLDPTNQVPTSGFNIPSIQKRRSNIEGTCLQGVSAPGFYSRRERNQNQALPPRSALRGVDVRYLPLPMSDKELRKVLLKNWV